MANERINIVISAPQLAELREIAELEQSSVSSVVRDCIRATLPQLLMVTRFVHDPRHSAADVLAFADQMEAALATVERSGVELLEGSAQAALSGVADLPADSRAPSSNTGPNSGTGGAS